MEKLINAILALPSDFLKLDLSLSELESTIESYNHDLAETWKKETETSLTEDARLDVTIKLLHYYHYSDEELRCLYKNTSRLVDHYLSIKKGFYANAFTSLCCAIDIFIKKITPTKKEKEKEKENVCEDNIIGVAIMLWHAEFKKINSEPVNKKFIA